MAEASDVLAYPRSWEYTLIGWDRQAIRAAVADVFIDLEHSLADAHGSRAGTYCAVRVQTIVRDEAHRNALFAALAAHAAVRMVL